MVIHSTLSKMVTFETGTKCPFRSRVCLIESQIEGVKKARDQLLLSILPRCLSDRESNKGSKERQGPNLGVHFTDVSVL